MSLTEVFAELKAAHEAGVFERYALGGAVGATVYLEPAATEDVDIFVTIRTPAGSRLVTMEPLYAFFLGRGAVVDGERLTIGGWLVQLLPPPTALVEDALEKALHLEVDGATVPVFSQEHLAAIALETNRLKDKVRLKQFLDSDTFDHQAFHELAERFGLQQMWTKVQAFLKENP